MTDTIRVLLADDQALVRGALASLLSLERDIEVVAQVARGDEVLEAARSSGAAVALLDVDPFQGRGPFSGAAMTARHLGAGQLVSHDTLAVESRLARIRTRVELALAPPEPRVAGRPSG